MNRLSHRQQRHGLSVVLLLVLVLATPLQAADTIKVPRGPGGAAKEVAEPASVQPAQPVQRIEPQPSPLTTPQAASSDAPIAGIHDQPALMAGAWKMLEGAEMLRIYRPLSQALPGLFTGLLQDTREFRTMALPFYDKTTLLEARARGENGDLILIHILLDPSGYSVLNGTSPVIHDHNEAAPIRLDTADQAAAYLRFFCGAVAGEEGPFSIIEKAEDLWLEKVADPSIRAQAAAKLIPLEIKADPEGDWRARAVVSYSNALFIGSFLIKRNGVVEMLDDQPIMTDLPLRRIGYKGAARMEICKNSVCPKLPAL